MIAGAPVAAQVVAGTWMPTAKVAGITFGVDGTVYLTQGVADSTTNGMTVGLVLGANGTYGTVSSDGGGIVEGGVSEIGLTFGEAM